MALARGGKAERVGLLHSGSCSWLALLRFSGGVASRPTVSNPLPVGPTPPPTAPEALILSLRLIGPAVDLQSMPAVGDFPLLVGLRRSFASSVFPPPFAKASEDRPRAGATRL